MIYFFSFVSFLVASVNGFGVYASGSFAVGFFLILRVVFFSNNTFSFREWTLFLYSLNYLISPAITYNLDNSAVTYPMKISSDFYFSMAFPGMFLFGMGLYIIPNKLFKPDFTKINKVSIVNEGLLKKFVIYGVLFKLTGSFVPGELNFFFYILSLLRFVGSFALYLVDTRKWFWPFLVLGLEFYLSFTSGTYHDSLMWFIFFSLLFVYVKKPTVEFKILGASAVVILILFIQAIKFSYREKVWVEGNSASLNTVAEVGNTVANSESLVGDDNLKGTINRSNQAWIFASTVDNMDRNRDFQGMNNVAKYLEAAIMPRFLAPNKIKSGGGEIFNKFSGHTINESTSMGLGVFADGYIAYGTLGVYVFTFFLGLIFSLTFKIIEYWVKISPIYVLMLLPILNYAVRPDCELQTTINHLFKSLIIFGILVTITKHRFTLNSNYSQRKLFDLSKLQIVYKTVNDNSRNKCISR